MFSLSNAIPSKVVVLRGGNVILNLRATQLPSVMQYTTAALPYTVFSMYDDFWWWSLLLVAAPGWGDDDLPEPGVHAIATFFTRTVALWLLRAKHSKVTDFESRSRHDGEIEVRDDNPWHCKKTCFEIAPHELHLMEWNEWNRRSSIPIIEF